MARREATVRVSSKGQIVLPASVRKELGLVSGSKLRLSRRGSEIVLTPVQVTADSVDEALRKLRDAARDHQVDGVEGLHLERQRERARQTTK